MEFRERGQVLTGPELVDLVAISPDEDAMKNVCDSRQTGAVMP